MLEPLDRVKGERIAGWLEELGREAAAAVLAEGIAAEEIAVRRRLLNLRFAGQEATLAVDSTDAAIEPAFAAAYREIYGYAPEGRAIELESIRVVASSRSSGADDARVPDPEPSVAVPAGIRRCWTGGGWRDVPFFDRSRLIPGAAFTGPALVFESHSATLVAERWQGRVDGAGNLALKRGVE